jgi:hypothetical protein
LDGQGDETCEWEQGDASLASLPFVTLDPGDGEGVFEVAHYEVSGFAIVTQTCDILRRDEIQIAALYLASDEELELTRLRRKPRFAYLPQLAPHNLIVDLDRVMTVRTSVLQCVDKVPCELQDSDRRLFADALARHKNRFAFPDDFVKGMQPLRKRLDEKKRKDSSEGRLINAAAELRVTAFPSWDAKDVELTLYCILTDDAHSNDRVEWLSILKKWEAASKLPSRLKFGGSILCTYHEMSAADYIGSDKLDLDFMSS